MPDFDCLLDCCLYLLLLVASISRSVASIDYLLPRLNVVASDCCMLLKTVADCNYDAQLGDSVAWLPRSDDACGLAATI